jgi:hypothetical protein
MRQWKGEGNVQVCDLFCGRGTDMANWTQVEIGKYVGVGIILHPFLTLMFFFSLPPLCCAGF